MLFLSVFQAGDDIPLYASEDLRIALRRQLLRLVLTARIASFRRGPQTSSIWLMTMKMKRYQNGIGPMLSMSHDAGMTSRNDTNTLFQLSDARL